MPSFPSPAARDVPGPLPAELRRFVRHATSQWLMPLVIFTVRNVISLSARTTTVLKSRGLLGREWSSETSRASPQRRRPR